jgi:hypothetical protein
MKEKLRVVLRLDLYVSLESEDKGDLTFAKRLLEQSITNELKDTDFEGEYSYPPKRKESFGLVDFGTVQHNLLASAGYSEYKVNVLRDDEVIKRLK